MCSHQALNSGLRQTKSLLHPFSITRFIYSLINSTTLAQHCKYSLKITRILDPLYNFLTLTTQKETNVNSLPLFWMPTGGRQHLAIFVETNLTQPNLFTPNLRPDTSSYSVSWSQRKYIFNFSALVLKNCPNFGSSHFNVF